MVTLDDATSAICSTFLGEDGGTLSSLRGFGEVIDRRAVFCELYTDRGSRYFHMPKRHLRRSARVAPRSHSAG
jgi:hypothetical protein